MFKKVQKIFFLTVLILCASKIFANPAIEEYVLEDGMHVYLLEDFSSALVRIEFNARAGFSKQNPDNAGFFPLYTEMFKYASGQDKKILSGLESECNADSSRYTIYVTPSEVKDTLKALAVCAFDPIFLDDDINRELEKAKKQVTENAFSVEGFINSSIDSRVFSESPWKHDSGIYPTIFSKTKTSSCRLLLYDIAENYYKPKNCALFISGPITKDEALKLSENTFGKKHVSSQAGKSDIYSKIQTDRNEKQKLFVLTDPEFSPDMTQIVIQYKSLEMEECDYTAQVLDNNGSLFKTMALSESSLGIRHPQYINAAGTHKNNSSRLIIQALLENPKASPCENALSFTDILENSISGISDEEFEQAGELLCNSFDLMLSDSSKTMDLLSQFWAIKDYNRESDYDSVNFIENFFSRPERIRSTSLDSIKRKVQQEKPFVFVLVNSSVFNKYEKEFQKNGFEIITVKNGSWYTQKLYAAIKDSMEKGSDRQDNSQTSEEKAEDLFFENNKNSISRYELKNHIPVFVKERSSTNTVSLCLMIEGGEITDEKNLYGLESVIVDTVAVKIKGFLYQKYMEGTIKNFPDVMSQTDFTSSAIYVECLSSDFKEVIHAFSEALIFSDFTPAMVDPVVLQRKSSQIVKTSSPVFQLTSSAVSILFKNKEYQTVYQTNQDILKKLNFTEILEASIKLFNADRYKIIVSGNVEEAAASFEEITELFDNTFGIIPQEGITLKPQVELNTVNRKNRKVKLVHLFLTDVSKEKAGPRPQVLIPTTEFLDPAQFWIKNESGNDKEPLFNALMNDFCGILQEKCDNVVQKQNMIVMNQACDSNIPFAQITILNVKNSTTVEDIFSKAFFEYKENLDEQTVKRIKANWIKKYLSRLQTNNGTSLAIKAGLDSAEAVPDKYILDYEKVMNASVEDFSEVFENFDFNNALKLYSADTKK